MYNFQQNRGTTSERLTLRSSTEHKSNKKHTDKRSLWKKKHTHCLKKCIPLNPKATLLSKQRCIDSQDIVFLFRISRDLTVYTNSYCNQSINQSINQICIYLFIHLFSHSFSFRIVQYVQKVVILCRCNTKYALLLNMGSFLLYLFSKATFN